MPATYDSIGLRFLYPDNWTQLDREDDEGGDGVTFELPSGGFFSIERDREGQLVEEVIEEVANAFGEDYGEIEREEIQLKDESDQERTVDFSFYYLDLLVVSRLTILTLRQQTYVIQIQAESRDFDENEQVFAAIMKQIRG